MHTLYFFNICCKSQFQIIIFYATRGIWPRGGGFIELSSASYPSDVKLDFNFFMHSIYFVNKTNVNQNYLDTNEKVNPQAETFVVKFEPREKSVTNKT